jgi:hypothetical protein
MQHANSYYTLLELHFFTIYVFQCLRSFYLSNTGTLFYLTAHVTVHSHCAHSTVHSHCAHSTVHSHCTHSIVHSHCAHSTRCYLQVYRTTGLDRLKKMLIYLLFIIKQHPACATRIRLHLQEMTCNLQ